MKPMPQAKVLSTLTFVLCPIVVIASTCGLLFERELYGGNVPAYAVQAVGADLAHLVVTVPTLLVTAVLLRRGSRRAFIVWFGTLLFASYGFTYTCFTLHFNRLFLLYTAEMGLAVYSLFIAIAGAAPDELRSWFDPATKRTAAIVFLALSGLGFNGLWLREIVPATLSGTLPTSVAFLGLTTPAYHALDLGVYFPAFFVSAALLLRRNGFGFLLAPAFLAFSTIMPLVLVFLNVMLVWKGLLGAGAAVADSVKYVVLAGISAVILVRFLRSCQR
jgi:hypothetical protein